MLTALLSQIIARNLIWLLRGNRCHTHTITFVQDFFIHEASFPQFTSKPQVKAMMHLTSVITIQDNVLLSTIKGDTNSFNCCYDLQVSHPVLMQLVYKELITLIEQSQFH